MATNDSTTIPYGYCHCGCGQKTNLANINDRKKNLVKGKPRRFIAGHQSKIKTKLRLGQTTEDRFWSKVDKSGGADACWNWTASLTRKGYGQFSINSKPFTAHRISYQFAVGEIPNGLFVCHTCDNRRCCNPKHLFVGTHIDNMQDMVRKGRQAVNQKGGSSKFGEENNQHKLTVNQVNYIRQRYAEGGIYQRELAVEMGVHVTTILRILNGKRWGWLK
jgi:hypothetical protein